MTIFPIPQEALCTEDSIGYCCACAFMWDEPLQSEERIDQQPKGTLPYCRSLFDTGRCGGPHG